MGRCSVGSVPFGDLAVQIDEIACEEPSDLARPGAQLGEGSGWDELCLPRDGELGFQAEQGTFGRDVRFALLGGGGAGEAVGDVGPDRQSGQQDGVGQDLGFSADAGPDRADDVASEGDRLLPDSKLS